MEQVLLVCLGQSLTSLAHHVKSGVGVVENQVNGVRLRNIFHHAFKDLLLVQDVHEVSWVLLDAGIELRLVDIEEIWEGLVDSSLVSEHIAACEVAEWESGTVMNTIDNLVSNDELEIIQVSPLANCRPVLDQLLVVTRDVLPYVLIHEIEEGHFLHLFLILVHNWS